MIQNGLQREKGIFKKQKNEQSMSERWQNFWKHNIHVIRLPQGKGRKVEEERNIWRNHDQNFSKSDKNYKLTDRETINPKHKKHEQSKTMV